MDVGTALSKIVDWLLQQGALGIIILGLLWYAWRLTQTVDAKDKQIELLQEKRLEERTTVLTALADNTAAMNKVASATEDNNDTLVALKASVDVSSRSVDLLRTVAK